MISVVDERRGAEWNWESWRSEVPFSERTSDVRVGCVCVCVVWGEGAFAFIFFVPMYRYTHSHPTGDPRAPQLRGSNGNGGSALVKQAETERETEK